MNNAEYHLNNRIEKALKQNTFNDIKAQLSYKRHWNTSFDDLLENQWRIIFSAAHKQTPEGFFACRISSNEIHFCTLPDVNLISVVAHGYGTKWTFIVNGQKRVFAVYRNNWRELK